MESLQHIEETIALGKKLVSEFNHNDRIPMTTRWMAHYIAELIIKVENEKDLTKKGTYQKECCELILELWRNRKDLPRNTQPLGNFEVILPVLEALADNEPEEPYWRNYRKFEDHSPWGRFMHKMRLHNEDIFKIILCSAVTKQMIDEGRDWLKFPNLISDSERKIIEFLDELLNRYTNPIRVVIVQPDGTSDDDKKAEVNMVSVFQKLENLLSEQQKELAFLKRIILEGEETDEHKD